MVPSSAQNYAENIRRLIAERLRITAPTLQKALIKSGRLLPRWARRNGAYLVQAEATSAHPKLRLTVDAVQVKKAHDALAGYLKTIDPAEQRKSRVLGILGVISFNLIIVVAAFVIYLVWRGFV